MPHEMGIVQVSFGLVEDDVVQAWVEVPKGDLFSWDLYDTQSGEQVNVNGMCGVTVLNRRTQRLRLVGRHLDRYMTEALGGEAAQILHALGAPQPELAVRLVVSGPVEKSLTSRVELESLRDDACVFLCNGTLLPASC